MEARKSWTPVSWLGPQELVHEATGAGLGPQKLVHEAAGAGQLGLSLSKKSLSAAPGVCTASR